MLTQINGLHHVTSLASGAQVNSDFFTKILGLRRVKKTVNFDRPDVYHLYYGDAQGTPGTVVRWINDAYRAERTVTSVRVDIASATIATSLDLRVVLEVPPPFRWVDKKKIEAAMREAFEPQTQEAMGKVCDEVAAAFVEWAGEA